MLFTKIQALNYQDDSSFSCGNHLLLWAWRRVAFGQGECPLLAREFVDACGEDGIDVLAMLQVFLHAIGIASRRRLALGMPGGFTLTRDEERVLRLLACARAGDRCHFESDLDLLVDENLREAVSIAAYGLAKAFAVNGLMLRMPEAEPLVCPQQAIAS